MRRTLKYKEEKIILAKSYASLNKYIKANHYSRVFILTDTNSRKYCLPGLRLAPGIRPEVINIPAGEQHKNIKTAVYVWEKLLAHKADRHSLLINLGGGVLTDLGGFAAAAYKRGIRCIHVPTTLLAMVDAAIGGKTGIDHLSLKNVIGLFNPPDIVFINTQFLKTLADRELLGGFAEIIKHGLIAGRYQWEQIKSIDSLKKDIDWEKIIQSSVQIKKHIVKTDPYERGLRKALNFGHTIGHAIETDALLSRKKILHGEAIAAGMICETYISCKMAGLSEKTLKEIAGYINKLYPAIRLRKKNYNNLLRIMLQDKKNNNQKVNFTLLNDIGKPLINQNPDKKIIVASLDFYNGL